MTKGKHVNENDVIQFKRQELKDISCLMSSIAHHWRQPLNILSLMIQNLTEEYCCDEHCKENMVDFNKNALSIIMELSATIDRFRFLMCPQKDKQIFCPEDEILLIHSLLQPIVSEQNIEFELIDNTCSRTEIHAVKFEFNQVLLHLIYNSIDAILENTSGNSHSKGCVSIYLEHDNGYLVVQVKDNGAGIEEHIQSRIFEPYFSTKEKNGIGLGLFICKSIVEISLGGSIAFSSNKENTAFIVKLPIVKIAK